MSFVGYKFIPYYEQQTHHIATRVCLPFSHKNPLNNLQVVHLGLLWGDQLIPGHEAGAPMQQGHMHIGLHWCGQDSQCSWYGVLLSGIQ